MKHVTIKDLAKELNCSISTVSRAFNDKYDIRKETRELILETAKNMGYHPNPIARKLISQRSYTIGVVIPEFVNAFFAEVIIGIQDVLFKKGYQTLIMSSNESSALELENVKTLENNMVDGIILSLSAETKDVAYYKELINKGFPLVLFNRVSEELNTHKVLFDDYKWAFFATEHMIYQGYKNIIHFAGPPELTLSGERKKGFKDAMIKHKLPVNEDSFLEAGFFISDGQQAMESLLKSNRLPDAILAVNDPCAIGAMVTLKKNGYKIPQDIAVVGFTETKFAELLDPPLTSVSQPTYDIGATAAELILKEIESTGIFVPQTLVLNGRLNIRESSMTL